jgi:hypothetical protein
MTDTDFKFCIKGLNTLKGYFKKPEVKQDIEFIKLILVTQDKEIKDLKRANKTLRLENIKLIRSKK